MRMTKIMAIGLLSMLICLSFAPTSSLTPGVLNKIFLEDQTRINIWSGYQEMDSDSESFIFHGIGFDKASLNDKEFGKYLPVVIDYTINGKEVNFQRFNDIVPNSDYWNYHNFVDEPCKCRGDFEVIWFMFYTVFEPGYFDPGWYFLEVHYYLSKDVPMVIDGWIVEGTGWLHVI